MSEDSYKRRLRGRKRRISATLEAQGYRVRTYESGPFHLEACRGKAARAIRIEFGYVDLNIIDLMRHEPVPPRCRREIWQVSADGRITVIAKISTPEK